MTNGAQVTGTRDEHYNLVSVLYHTLQAGETYEQYIQDAEQANDTDLADFFRQAQDQNRQRAERAKKLLQDRVGSA
jgi:rubrerythrin